MDVIYQKTWADLWGNKARTIQVALVVALGAFGVGLVVGARNLILDAINTDYRNSAPPAIGLIISPPITEEDLLGLKSIDGVESVEGTIASIVQWRASPEDEWTDAFLRSRPDFENQTLSKEDLLTGEWPTRRDLAISKGTDDSFGVFEGDTVYLRINDRDRDFDVVGTIKSPRAAPFFTGNPDFFIERSQYEALVGSANFDTIFISIGEFDQEKAERIDALIEERLDKLGYESFGAEAPLGNRITPPDRTPVSSLLDALFAIMGLVGGVIIFLGLFLVFNSVSAIITQQVDQIGVMKAIGARQSKILWSYMILIFTYGFLATLIAVPLGALAANGLKNFFLDFTNTTNPGFQFDPIAVVIQVIVAFLAPIFAALIPITRGTRITVREAISSYGIGGSSGMIDRFVARAKAIPYSILLTIGNVFRNTQRVILVQLTLVGSGIIFIAVTGVSDSTNFTFSEELKSIHNYEAAVRFETAQRPVRIDDQMVSVPGVESYELWNTGGGTIRPISQADATNEDEGATLLGMPTESVVYSPNVTDGRWLTPEDTNQIVMHSSLAETLGVGLGDQVVVARNDGKESTWLIVGLHYDPVRSNIIHAPQEPLARFLGDVNQVNSLFINTNTTDADLNKEIVLGIESRFEDQNIAVAPGTVFNGNTIDDIIFSKLFTYQLLLQLLSIMAVVIAIVGGIGLSGVLSLSVLERTREIGVMRAIGASSGQILRLFIGEGLLLGMISWVIALPLSIPLSYFLTTSLLTTILNEDILYRFTLTGPGLWLIIISVLAIVASWFPARSATKVSVQESLAYQ